MAEHLTEEEQLEALKRWWKENGKSTVAAIAVIGAGFFGWNQYQSHQVKVAQEGSALYEEFIAATTELGDKASDEQKSTVMVLADGIVAQNPNGLYANFAELHVAKLAVEGGNLEEAKKRLQAVSTNGNNDAIKELATLRLARVEMALGSAEQALKVLQKDVSTAYAGAYAELRGDIMLSQKKYGEARTAYQTALDNLNDPRSMSRSLIQLKIDSASVADSSSPADATMNTESAPETAPEKVAEDA